MRFTLRHVVFAGTSASVAACAAVLGIDDRLPLVDDAGTEAGGGGGETSTAETGTDGSTIVDAEAGVDVITDAGAYKCPDGAPVHSCGTCGGMLVGCPTTGQCITECRDQCGDASPIACVTCTPDGGYTATCATDKTPAPSCAPSGCACAGTNAAACPLGNMVCIGNDCTTCGDVDTHDLICRTGTGNAKCKLGDEGDETKRYRCK